MPQGRTRRGRGRGGGGRPFKIKAVRELPAVNFYKPIGVPLNQLALEVLSVEEVEALRLVDLEDLEQAEAAEKMGISRKTVWRLLHDARKKLISALVEGKAIEIKGGYYSFEGKVMGAERIFKCFSCEHEWSVPRGTGRPMECPKCKNKAIARKS